MRTRRQAHRGGGDSTRPRACVCAAGRHQQQGCWLIQLTGCVSAREGHLVASGCWDVRVCAMERGACASREGKRAAHVPLHACLAQLPSAVADWRASPFLCLAGAACSVNLSLRDNTNPYTADAGGANSSRALDMGANGGASGVSEDDSMAWEVRQRAGCGLGQCPGDAAAHMLSSSGCFHCGPLHRLAWPTAPLCC